MRMIPSLRRLLCTRKVQEGCIFDAQDLAKRCILNQMMLMHAL
ncbi:hypothetical protein F383_31894 [Gossypium arboreum]|uniref:Uncharacterized protein n=1 Tax=Gossypium arboreum TaxID=29729 RepID=A0A0B0N4S5_GOSAR|nr:hypothetical protein F383_31894 [Gossypium arboreum]